jgi:bacteriocin biosynthesis cyclodehydratase domain-containing protein
VTDETICLICPDEFGAAVGDDLAKRLGERAVRYDGPVAAGLLPVAATYVVVAGRPLPAALQALDGAVHAWRRRLVPVTVEHPYLRLGPVVVPGVGACYQCFAARQLQHSLTPEYGDAVLEHWRAPAARSFPGWLPPLAGFAAAWVERTLAREPALVAGRVEQLHLVNLQLVGGRAVGIHGCRRCGLRRDERRRSVEALAPVAAELAAVTS